jgi:hypothetical protein
MHVCYLDCYEAVLCYHLLTAAVNVHYSCFTSSCNLFTDSPSYYVNLRLGHQYHFFPAGFPTEV